uniref:Coiled-coil domain containing 51 n=1 Tax=Lepisosteus oculatus TaxID=7918 RepID=W5N805_LEPOC|nr:PREDICTED: coiled-coil domain-containing protein 51 isoform X1 [Lepisosteus oculatus]XP_015203501.1 PREDICTED: coiled-coil domain-containing protein 51 isoform X1 [Lepisosteus oculatus]
MRYRVDLLPVRYGTRCYLAQVSGNLRPDVLPFRFYCAQNPKEAGGKLPLQSGLQKFANISRQWGQSSVKGASAAINNWWEKYEEFVGLNEVRDAQAKVTEAEQAFMVARGIVREAHESLEALQVRLKEVRDRLDRVSREEVHYLELATLEHKLLQEERRLRTAYRNAEEAEREKFALFSAGVRESHEKERARAERTKNWSVIGSVLGALIGVLGSTYINRVRLQELKSLLLEAQKGPVSLQEAIKVQASIHESQQEELGGLINSLRGTLQGPKPADKAGTAAIKILPSASDSDLKEQLLFSKKIHGLIEGIQPQLRKLEHEMGKVASELQTVKVVIRSRPTENQLLKSQDVQPYDTEGIMLELTQSEKRLEAQINRNTMYNTVLTYTAFALTLPVLYLIFKSN